MANLLNQLTIDNVNYDLYDSEFIIDTRTASGAALTGVSHAPELFDGMQITFWLSYAAASNATLNLTLADGTTTGAIPCYYSGTTRMGTQYAAGNAIRFIYRENVTIGSTTIAAGWWSDANYSVSDTNYDIVGTSIPIKTRLNAYCLCGMVGTEGTIAKQTNTAGAGTYWEINAFTQSSGTGTSKKLVPNQGYYPGKIFYYTGSSAITDASSVSGTISGGTNNVDLRYTVNGSTSANIGVTGAPFFFVGSLGSDGLFYPNGHASEATKEWWQCGFPTDLTSTYIYWYVGMMSSKYQCRLSDTNWMLKSDGTKWIVFDGASKVYWDNIEGKPSTYTPASHTHGYIGNDGAITDAVATTPASGDKIVVTDSSDSNKVKGAITIGSDDDKYLKHDGAWDTPDDHILVMTGIPTGGLDSAPITTTTTWNDYITAITNHDRLVLDIPSAHSRIEFQAQRDDGSTVNVLYAITNSGLRIVTSASYDAESDANGLVVFTKDDSTVSFSQFAGEVNWSGILDNPYPLNAPSTNGNYSLNVLDGTTSWTTAGSGGPNTPDAPATDGNYVLNVNSGSSSWQEAPEGALIVEFNSNFRSATPKTDIDAAISAGRPVCMVFNNIVATLLSKMTYSANTDYYYFIVPTNIGSLDARAPQIWSFLFMDLSGEGTQALLLYYTSGIRDDIFAISNAGTLPSLSYTSTTASRATLSNGLLSFTSVSSSEISSWSVGSLPTLSSASLITMEVANWD